MVALGHHLGADKHLYGAGGEGAERVLEPGTPANRIAVEDRALHPRQELLEVVGHLLGAGADRIEEISGAGGTALWVAGTVVAVVAAEVARSLVDHERHRARGALNPVAAVAAEEDWRPSSALHEEDHLLAAIDGFAEQLAKAARKQSAALLSRFGRFTAEIDQLHLGEGAAGHPASQPQVPGQTALDQRRGFYRWRGGGKNHRYSKVLRRHQRKVAGVVAGCLLLFVGGVVLLVDHDQTEILKRREECGPRTDDDSCPAFTDSPPLPPTISLGEGRMEDRRLRPESTLDRA